MERRWFIGLGPPIFALSAIALATPVIATPLIGHGNHPDGETVSRPALDRIPDVVSARAWLAQRGDGAWVYGRAGSTKRQALPQAETAIAIGRRYVASTLPTSDGTSHLRLREWRTGSVAVDLDSSIWISAGAFSGDDLVVTGYGDARATSDGGLAVVRVGSGRFETVVPERPFPQALGASASRGDVFVSASGRRAASYLCAADLCDVQVIDVSSGRLVRSSRQTGFLRAITDSAMILTDGEFKWISARELATGREIWRLRDSILMNPVAAAGGSVVGLVGSRPAGWAVARIGATGRAADLTERVRDGHWPQVWAQLSTPEAVVIGRGDFAEALSGTGQSTADIIDVQAGSAIGRDLQLLPGE